MPILHNCIKIRARKGLGIYHLLDNFPKPLGSGFYAHYYPTLPPMKRKEEREEVGEEVSLFSMTDLLPMPRLMTSLKSTLFVIKLAHKSLSST